MAQNRFKNFITHPTWQSLAAIATILALLFAVFTWALPFVKTLFLHSVPATSTSAGSLSEFRIPTPNSLPIAMAKGSDGNFWFTEQTGNRIGRITPQGNVIEFPVPTPDSGLGG